MITGRDANKEDKKLAEILNSDVSVSQKLKAIGKLLSVIMRLVLSNRTNVVRIMEHLKVPKLKSEQKNEKEEKK
jgi:hypothetical protein